MDAEDISVSFSIPCVRLLNDVTAAYAIPQLTERQLEFLQTDHRDAKGNAALIASGTGLGESILQNLHGTLIPTPSEGGHADFTAPYAGRTRISENFNLNERSSLMRRNPLWSGTSSFPSICTRL